MNKVLKEYVKQILSEDYADISEVGIKIHVLTYRPSDPTMLDILTKVRGLPHVITVRQYGVLQKAAGRKKIANLRIGLEMTPGYSVEELAKDIRGIRGIEQLKVVYKDGSNWETPSGAPLVI
jgi:hypothetical protein